jgi:hypothetical protein
MAAKKFRRGIKINLYSSITSDEGNTGLTSDRSFWAMRLYAAYVLCDIKPDYLVLVGAFFLTLATYAFDRQSQRLKKCCESFHSIIITTQRVNALLL